MKKINEILSSISAIILILGALYIAYSTYVKIGQLDDEAKNTRLYLGQIRSKIIKSNQVAIDLLLNSSLTEREKSGLKNRYDEINSSWSQFQDGGKIEGPSMHHNEPKMVK